MKKRSAILLVFLCLLAALLLCACGAAAEPTPAETAAPEATPEPTAPPTELTLTDESAEEILALAEQSSLRHIDAKACREYEALLQLRQALPECEIEWVYEWQGTEYPSDTKSLTVNDMSGLEDALRFLPDLEEVDLLAANAELEDLDRFSAVRPDIFYLWEFHFAGSNKRIRTDIQVYSSLQALPFVRHDDEYYYPLLKYCKHLQALDLGHNDLRDLSLIGQMEDLQVLILADNPRLRDASPIGNLHKLVFLELFLCPEITDWDFLRELTQMKDLNLCYCEGLRDLDFLTCMPDFCFGLFKYSGVDPDNYNSWKEKLPDAHMVLQDWDEESTGSGWRDTRRNRMIRKTFYLWEDVVDYRAWDDVDFEQEGFLYHLPDLVPY